MLESALLPPVPERVGSLAASAAHRSSGPAAGGDFYDCFELDDGRAAVIVGDVSGHGREALERTRSICSTLRAYLDAGVEPRVALEMADHALPGDDSGNFATVVVGVHDPGFEAHLRLGRHPAPIVTGPGAHAPVTDGSSPPLGVGVRTGLRQTTVPLGAGAAACFFTDGLLEARVKGRLLGRTSLERMLGEDCADASALIERVEAAADEAADDMAACLVRARDGSPPAEARVEELELEGARLDSKAPARFLAACGVEPDAIDAALGEARLAAGAAGAAVLHVTIAPTGASVAIATPDFGQRALRPRQAEPAL